ncbi:MAG: purine-nucleoside phosphorylase [Thermodesulfobacteriota bacterium]
MEVGGRHRVGILTGTGLGEVAAGMADIRAVDYAAIPHFPTATVAGHYGKLLSGNLANNPLLVMQGRFHLYEGYSPRQVAFPIRLMKALGIEIAIILNAAGGLNPCFREGDIMLLSDHINLTACNPLTGPNEDTWGIRFPDMSAVYDGPLRGLADSAGRDHGIRFRQGVYAGLPGPALETPAETRWLRAMGADAVGFSTIQEVIAAVHAGLRVLGLSIITNLNDPEHPARTTLESVLQVARRSAAVLAPILGTIVERIHEPAS